MSNQKLPKHDIIPIPLKQNAVNSAIKLAFTAACSLVGEFRKFGAH